ncbi:MAG: tRNA (adenosine(37)-N6)-threonylcarbamoyltransferase complex transferase subunit TsaD [Candidatus Eisenbacteria bacterium]|nr:tRNA (adenosine(37)-N6)-threonylcarbamoyltransferase complex transferase subunit TsaD [Candidatus Eisenbacteria bacterium]
MLVLGIETSCDETAAAVLKDGRSVLSSVVASQDVHAAFGGVVPEYASRAHMRLLAPVARAAVERAGASWTDLGAVAVTNRPGLVGCLLVGVSFAKALSYALDIPLVGVDHVEGHVFSLRLTRPDLALPAVCLVASGGHTELVLVEAWGAYRTLGRTRDDAAGEAFDKVGKLLGLPYPAGPVIERLAAGGNAEAHRFPRAMMEAGNLDFSFSGVKTAVRLKVGELGRTPEGEELADVAASFQEAVIDALAVKTIRAAERERVSSVSVGGGVAANDALRRRIEEEAARVGVECVFPPKALCTDNGVVIAAVGDFLLSTGHRDDLALSASASRLDPLVAS